MAESSPTGQQPPAASGAPSEAPSVWNVPNALTTLRIVMVPFFGWALLTDGGDSVLWRLVAWAIFAVAMITDKIDGDLARKHGLVTDFGKIADPIADKAITGMAFIGLSLVGDLWWWVTVLVLLREWSVTGMRLLMARHAVIPAARGGKIKTVLQTFALGLLVLPLRQVGDTSGGVSGALAVAGSVLWWGAVLLMAAAVVMTVWTGVEFFRDAVVQRREHKRASV
jgi:CDP-diacylglycerol--glycerol-3-phosphate 3-phosphatidyltransferase